MSVCITTILNDEKKIVVKSTKIILTTGNDIYYCLYNFNFIKITIWRKKKKKNDK